MLRRVMKKRAKNTTKTKAKPTTTSTRKPRKSARSQALSGEQISELIQTRAYEIYRQRNWDQGDHMSDWLTAENQVRQELGIR